MQQLSLLPLFMDLRNKSVLVAGNSDGLIWKAELILAAGATLRVITSDRAIFDALKARAFSVQPVVEIGIADNKDFIGISFAIGAFDVAEDALAFMKLAKAHGVPVNLVDRPALSDLQFGAIVNRSPIVAAIATDGKAPSLGRAIRNRIEAMLPNELADWADRADSFRAQTTNLSGAQKRQFWMDYAQMALSNPKSSPTEHAINNMLEAAQNRGGELVVIDVGPSDRYDLLTLEALGYLQRCDLILCQHDVDARVLDFGRREAVLKTLEVGAVPHVVLADCNDVLDQAGCVIWLHTKGHKPDLGQFERASISVHFLGAGS